MVSNVLIPRMAECSSLHEVEVDINFKVQLEERLEIFLDNERNLSLMKL